MTKDKLGNELMLFKFGYRKERWKWCSQLPLSSNPEVESCLADGTHLDDIALQASDVTPDQLAKVYGFDKIPKTLPCQKRCLDSPWCLRSLVTTTPKTNSKVPLTKLNREDDFPVGLQNTTNTCWINSALQVFFNLRKFRNAIHSIPGFVGSDSLGSLVYLLQAIFAQMESHPYKAIACDTDSVFERLANFATLEVMKKDAANNEILKCVSEFMENTIDLLVADPTLSASIAPMFTITLTRVAKWKCSNCSLVHQSALAPASSYTMGAYISADETPLAQCLMDLQQETQTGVFMTCGESSTTPHKEKTGGCGARVQVDRIVTPKLETLPQYLIIRNNSLVSEDVKRRLHVSYPECLDLSKHTMDGRQAKYILSGVIFHHGHWVRHYSAHVKTDGGLWYSFNDESVMEVNFKKNQNNANPPENHPNYFSLGAVSAKYKSKILERVSRGAFIWVYSLISPEPTPDKLPPPATVVEYNNIQNGIRPKDEVAEQLISIQSLRHSLISNLSPVDSSAPYHLVNENILYTWLNCQDISYSPSPALLKEVACPHGNIKPMMAALVRCVRADKIRELIDSSHGLHPPDACTPSQNNGHKSPNSLSLDNKNKSEISSDLVTNCDTLGDRKEVIQSVDIKPSVTSIIFHNGADKTPSVDIPTESSNLVTSIPIPVVKPLDGGLSPVVTLDSIERVCGPQRECSQCVLKHVHHILFIERLKNMLKLCKKAALNVPSEGYRVVGSNTLLVWPRIASHFYIKRHSIELLPLVNEEKAEEEEVPQQSTEAEESLPQFNEDLVCPHNMLSPSTGVSYLPSQLYREIEYLCCDRVHPATYLEDFSLCTRCQGAIDETQTLRQKGQDEKSLLLSLFNNKRRPDSNRDLGTRVYLVDRDFVDAWKTFVRSCTKATTEPRPAFSNADFFCRHHQLHYDPCTMEPSRVSALFVVLWETEWETLSALYGAPEGGVISATVTAQGYSSLRPNICSEGCLESQAIYDYEDQFKYSKETIYVRQVKSPQDIPNRVTKTRSMGLCPSGGDRIPLPHSLLPPLQETNGSEEPSIDRSSIGEPVAKQAKLSTRVSARSKQAPLSPSKEVALARMVRGSKVFSSTDTMRQVMNFIAEKSGVWPMLQTIWLPWCEDMTGVLPSSDGVVQLTEEHQAMTLGALRVKPDDTVYFSASKEEMELAAGDGITEYDEMPAP